MPMMWYARSVIANMCAVSSQFLPPLVAVRIPLASTMLRLPLWEVVPAAAAVVVASQYLAPVWVTRRIASTKRERLSKRFWLLGPYLAALCLSVDLLITLAIG